MTLYHRAADMLERAAQHLDERADDINVNNDWDSGRQGGVWYAATLVRALVTK